MNKKITTIALATACLSVGALALVLTNNVNDNFNAADEPYVLLFDKSHNIFANENNAGGTIDAFTSNKNPISFAYNNISKYEGGWQILNSGASISNSTAISGIKNIVIHLADIDPVNINFEYGWDLEYGYQNQVSNSNNVIEYNFDGQYPSYFKMNVNNTVEVLSMEIVYSCIPSQKPGEETEGLQYMLNNGEYAISGYQGDSATVYIPESKDGYPVTAIEMGAFKDNKTITKVVVPDSVKIISLEAFANCSNLSDVQLGSGLKEISSEAFMNDFALTSITIPNGVNRIDDSAFSRTSITEIVLPDSVTNVGTGCFLGCSKLSKVTLSQSLLNVSSMLFQDCQALTSIIVPDSVTSIGRGAFYNCKSLSEIILPDHPISIYYNFIDYTQFFKDKSNWENGVLYVGKHAICNNSDFKTVANYAFKDGTLDIADTAFYYNCDALETLVIPSTVKIIGAKAFYGHSKLTNVTIDTEGLTLGVDVFTGSAFLANNTIDGVAYINDIVVGIDKSYAGSTLSIKEGTKRIIDGKMLSSSSDASKFTAIVFPDSLQIIGNENFYSFKNVTSVTFGKSLTQIGNSAFWYCGITSIDISQCTSLISIGSNCFSGNKFPEIFIPNNVSVIKKDAFSFINNLTINCEAISKPGGWDENWSGKRDNYTQTINWGVQK